jgi:hypothetical protein
MNAGELTGETRGTAAAKGIEAALGLSRGVGVKHIEYQLRRKGFLELEPALKGQFGARLIRGDRT